MEEDFWRGQDGNGARGSQGRGANNGRSTEEIIGTIVEEKDTLEIISIYLRKHNFLARLLCIQFKHNHVRFLIGVVAGKQATISNY